MKTVHKSVLIWYSAEEMFDLVSDVDKYSDFLPWCDKASVHPEGTGMKAEIGIAFAGLHQTFTTHNEQIPGREITMKLIEGPFSELDGRWRFTPLGNQQRACKVELELNYGFSNATLSRLIGPVFDKIASSMVDAFVKRAEQVYG